MNRALSSRRSFRTRPGLLLEMLETRVTPAMFTVSNLNDLRQGSLRQAITDANLLPDADTIDFTIAGTILLGSGALPDIIGPVTIDGRSAPGFGTAPVVEVDANNFTGLTFASGSNGSSLLSLGVIGTNGPGIKLNDSNITVAGNYVGLALDGLVAPETPATASS